jgi:hypothetical protein
MSKKLFYLVVFAMVFMAAPVWADSLNGLADVTVVDDAIVSLRYADTEYVVADGDLVLGATTRWYIPADTGVPTLWIEGDPAPEATVGGSSNPKEGDFGSKADNFLFRLEGSNNISSIDGIDYQETIFPFLTDTVFLFERGGNDTGTWQAILEDGSLGEEVPFEAKNVYADTGVGVGGQNAFGVVFTTDEKVMGVRITASGHDTLSISTPVPPPPVPADPGTEGLIAHYAFENDTTDSSGNGLDGTVVGDPAFVEGVEGMALDFNGDDYVDCGGAAEFSFTESMTVSTWVNIRSVTTAWMAMVAKGENAWRLGVNNETTGIHYAFTGGARGWQAANTATELPFDEWHHVAATYDTTVGAQVYIDGVVDATNPDLGGIVTNEFSLLLGDNPEEAGRLLDGVLDEVKIYNRALSEGEILYLAGFGQNLVLNSSFEEDEDILDDPTWYSWCTWNPAEGAGSNATIVDTDAVDGTRSLLIEPVGPENWHFIVVTMPIPTEVGAGYTASFWAKAAEPRPLGVQWKATDNTESWGYAGFDLTTEWAEYTLTADALNAETKLEFFCAASEVSFLLDSVSVVKVSPAPEPEPEPEPGPEPELVFLNGGFEDGVPDPWSTYGDASLEVVQEDPVEGAYCLHVTVNSAGANSWDAGLQNSGHVFVAGKSYTLSAFVKAKEGTMDINFKPERAADPWEGYGEQVFTMTEEWTECTVNTGVIPETVDPASITFHIAFTAGEFYMDDVRFTED